VTRAALRASRSLFGASLALGLTGSLLHAQQISRPTRSLEWRADALVAQGAGALVGAMMHLPLGTYARIGVGVGSGAVLHDGATRSVTRADVIFRGLFDPLRETRRGVSLGGGLTVTNARDGEWRPYVALVVDFEGARRGGYAPAVQLGLGGGARLGFALRQANPRWR
jgi:hypothetical protein